MKGSDKSDTQRERKSAKEMTECRKRKEERSMKGSDECKKRGGERE